MNWPEIIGGAIGGLIIGLGAPALRRRLADRLRGVKPPPKR